MTYHQHDTDLGVLFGVVYNQPSSAAHSVDIAAVRVLDDAYRMVGPDLAEFLHQANYLALIAEEILNGG